MVRKKGEFGQEPSDVLAGAEARNDAVEGSRSPRIADLSEEDRPREKLLAHGVKALTNTELIAILLGSGTRDLSAIGVAQNLLSSAGHRLSTLLGYSVRQYQRHKGIGQAKAISLIAALELGYRLSCEEVAPIEKVSCSQDIARVMRPLLNGLSHEQMWVLFLNRANCILAKKLHSRGGLKDTVVDVRLILREALEVNADAIALAHNHPSGEVNPSPEDIQITREVEDAAALFSIRLVDHVVLAGNRYISVLDNLRGD